MTDKHQHKFAVIIVAGGTGTRFNADLPKQYAKIGKKTILRHTLDVFLSCPNLLAIQVVINETHGDLYSESIAGLSILPPATGGNTRQQSVFNGLASLKLNPDDIVLIHDAARPCLTPDYIQKLVDAVATHRAATLICPVSDTLRRHDENYLHEIVDRNGLVTVQTPQGFRYGDIMTAHQKHARGNFTDDTTLASAAGLPVAFVTGPRTNIKITHAEDIMLAEKLLTSSYPVPRTATGFDVHAFGDAASHIRIGGIDIPHTHKLAGHSDADVVLHAITDALYGLIADGDIGSHFPPGNNDYKGMDSAVFLKAAMEAVIAQGGRVTHIDTTVICESPKIGPHRDIIRTRIAAICDLDVKQISVKATTTEQLGFTGRREGIAAQAIVTGLF